MNNSNNPSANDINQLVALYNQRRYADLEGKAGAMVKRFPASGFAWKLLGAAQQMQGKNALEAFSKTAKLLPSEPDAHFNLGVSQKSLGQFNEAAASYRQALKLNPKYAEAYDNLGNVLKVLGKLDETVDCYRKAISLKPNFALTHNKLGDTLKALGNYSAAIESFNNAIRLKPDYAEAYINLGSALKELERYEEATHYFLHALEYKKDSYEALTELSHLYMIGGNTEEAVNTANKAISINPMNLEARFLLTSMHKVQADDPNLASLLQIAQDDKSNIPYKKKATLHYVLGKCLDALGEYDSAFSHFDAGSKMRRATFEYEAAQMSREFDDLINAYDQDTLQRLQDGGSSSDAPIFVLGMPRSGTTLTEQIIASHPAVHGAGELSNLLNIAQRTVREGGGFPHNINSLDRETLAKWGEDYVTQVRQHAPDAKHITDKMPDNFKGIGLIHLMLPNAKIIHVKRNPVDTCLSCYSKLFMMGMHFTYDLAELGQYYVDYVRLMDHWRTVLPAGAFLDVQYEDIVADKESQARRIIDFCGLEWDDACLDFHKLKRSVNTASVAQVRQPIYNSSVERWRAYEKHLGPLLNALGVLKG